MSVAPYRNQEMMWWASHSLMEVVQPAQEHTPWTANMAMRWPTDASLRDRPRCSGTPESPSTVSRKSLVPSIPSRTRSKASSSTPTLVWNRVLASASARSSSVTDTTTDAAPPFAACWPSSYWRRMDMYWS